MKMTLTRRALMAATAATTLAFAAPVAADEMVDSIHFLIPGGAGGGWDGTARGTGEALTKAGLVGNASYENMSGGGGGKAIGYLIENAESITGKEVPRIEGPRRPGDCTKLVSGSSRAEAELDWTPARSTLDQMIGDAWRWHQTGHYDK